MIGAPVTISLLKSRPEALARLAALALTDGMSWGVGGWSSTRLLEEAIPGDQELTDSGAGEGDFAMRDTLLHFKLAAPEAFEPISEAVAAKIIATTCNFVSSEEPAGTPVVGDGEQGAGALTCVSAGSQAHPSTTHAATEHVFEFLVFKWERVFELIIKLFPCSW